MHVLILGPSDLSYNSGSIIYTKNLYKNLKKHGHSVTLFTCKKCDDSFLDYEDIIFDAKLLDHPLITDREVNKEEITYYITKLFQEIEKINQRKKIDIIHVLYASFLSYVAAYFYKVEKIPFVCSCFGRDINIGLNTNLYDWFINLSLPLANKIIVPNNNLYNIILKNYSTLEKSILKIVTPPVDFNINESIDDYNINHLRFNIVTINSCFKEDKNILTILKALIKLPFADLYIAGTDDHPQQENYKNLQNFINENNLNDQVHFTGYLTRKEVYSILKAADLFVDARLTSSFSSVLIEALYSNIPILCSENLASIAIINGKNGWLFPPQDDLTLAHLINKIHSNSIEVKAMKIAQKDWLEKNRDEFSIEKHFEKIINIYFEVLNV